MLRDYEATVVATDSRGGKELLVNGVGITALTPITKMMVHLPMAFLARPPQNALVVCFGMGTSFRSALSWGVPTTAVELVPSVPRLVGFYHQDGPDLLVSPLARVVIDDGRRLLERTPDRYDVITIDPPPPASSRSRGGGSISWRATPRSPTGPRTTWPPACRRPPPPTWSSGGAA